MSGEGSGARSRPADRDGELTLEPGAPPGALPAAEGDGHALFGRGMLYVAVWSLQLVSAVLAYPILAHLMPPGEFGQMAAAASLSQVLVAVAMVGIDQAVILIRAETGSDLPARSLIGFGLALATVITAVLASTAPLWSPQLGFPGATPLVLLTLGWTVPAVGVLLASVMLLSQDRLKAFSLVNVLYGVGGQAVGMAMLLTTGSRTAATYAVGNLVALTATMVLGFALVRPRWRSITDVALAGRALRLGMPLMISSLAVYVLNAGDRLVIQRMIGSAEAGRYQIAYNVGAVAIILLGLASQAWAPHIAAVRDEARRWALIAHTRDALLRLMIPVIIGLTLGAPLGLMIAAPASFRPEELLVVTFLVAASGFPVLIGNATARALITLERTSGLAVAALAAAATNIALNVALIPVWGLAGSALATLVAFTVQTLLHRAALPRRIAWPGVPWRLAAAGCAACAAAAVTVLLPQDPVWNAGRFLIALACLPWFLRTLRAARAGAAGRRPQHRAGRRRRGEAPQVTGAGPPAGASADGGPRPGVARSGRHAR